MNKLSENHSITESYDEKRLKDENDSYVCEFTREDKGEDFVAYDNKNSISDLIKPSIYETNSFLEKKQPTLIEYCVFYGSIQILRYLDEQKNKLTPSLFL